MHRMNPKTMNYLAPDVKNAKVEKPCGFSGSKLRPWRASQLLHGGNLLLLCLLSIHSNSGSGFCSCFGLLTQSPGNFGGAGELSLSSKDGMF